MKRCMGLLECKLQPREYELHSWIDFRLCGKPNQLPLENSEYSRVAKGSRDKLWWLSNDDKLRFETVDYSRTSTESFVRTLLIAGLAEKGT